MATGNLLGEYQLPRSAGVFETSKKTPGWPFLWRLCLAPSSFQIIFEGICEGISMNIIYKWWEYVRENHKWCSGNITGMCLRGNS